jgi:hypothetical protein
MPVIAWLLMIADSVMTLNDLPTHAAFLKVGCMPNNA